MKKIFSLMTAVAAVAFAFTSCEDVPSPYDEPSANHGDKNDTTQVVVEPMGTGTAADPYNVEAALQMLDTMKANEQSALVYVKGVVTNIDELDTGNYGNATYHITDNGSNTLEIYRGYKGPNREKFTSEDDLKKGDTLIVCGNLVNFKRSESDYNVTKEFTQGSYIYSRNGVTTDGKSSGEDKGTPTGDGSQNNPFNAVAATNACVALGTGNTSTENYYIKGKISEIKYTFSADYGTATFWISDDGTSANQFQAYSVLYLGNRKWAEGDTQIKVGDDVVIYGKLTNYNGTAETASRQAYVYSLNGVTAGGDSPTPDNPTVLENVGVLNGNTLTISAAALGVENANEMPALKTVDGLTVTFSQGEGTNSPKYYTRGGVRMYAKNVLGITGSKTIASIVLHCADASHTGNSQLSATPGVVSKEDATVTVSGIKASSATIINDYSDNKGGTQLHIASIVITYAE